VSDLPVVSPPDLLDRRLWTARRLVIWGCSVTALVLAPLVATNGYYLTLATNIVITMVLTLSLNFIIGRLGLFSLAHSAFFGVGGYIVAILAQRHGIDPWLTLPVGMLGSAVAAAVIGVPVLRLKGMFLSVATLAFGLLAEVIARQASELTGGPYGITDLPPLTLRGRPLGGVGMYEVALAVLLLVALMFENIKASRFGRAMAASRDNEPAAAAVGIDIARTRLAGFVLAAAVAGTAGWLYTFFHLTLNPYVLSLDITFLWLFIVLVGGLGSMRGVAIATVLLGAGPELIGFATTQQVLMSGVLVLVVVLLAPRGIDGLIEQLMRLKQPSKPGAEHGSGFPAAVPSKHQ
jgi:branched-chain amino acid transport system permease protein